MVIYHWGEVKKTCSSFSDEIFSHHVYHVLHKYPHILRSVMGILLFQIQPSVIKLTSIKYIYSKIKFGLVHLIFGIFLELVHILNSINFVIDWYLLIFCMDLNWLWLVLGNNSSFLYNINVIKSIFASDDHSCHNHSWQSWWIIQENYKVKQPAERKMH